MAVKFSQFTVGATVSDIDYIVGYKSTDNIQIPIGLVTANTTYSVATAQSGLNETLTLTGSDASTNVITFSAGNNISLTDNGTGSGFTIEATINPGDITGVSASTPLTGGGTSGDVTIGIQQSSGVQNGYLSSTDWNTFNNKSDTGGTVTSVGTSTTALTALTLSGTVTTSGTLDLAKTGGTAGQYIDGATGAWTSLPAGETYDLNSTTDGANVDVNLTSTSGTDNSSIKLVPAGGITISQVGNVVTLDTSASGTGTVTSVGLTMPSAFAVSGSPVTTSGTLAVTSTGGSAGQYLDYTGAWSTPPSGAPTKTVDTATIANATTGTFTLSVSPSSENYVDMFISGVYQSKTTYAVSGTTVTLDGGTFFPNGAVVETVTTT